MGHPCPAGNLQDEVGTVCRNQMLRLTLMKLEDHWLII